MSKTASRLRPRTSIPVPQPPTLITDATDPNTPAPPNPLRNVIDAINAPANIIANDGQTFILDVIPDHRFPLLSWLFSIIRELAPTCYTTHPLASPSSVIGYTYALYVALLYHNDARIRPTPSSYAQEVMSNAFTDSFFNRLLDLPVPAFAAMEFEALRFFNDDIAANLITVGSAAAFDFERDFGRFFTVGTFLRLHTLLTSVPGNTPVSHVQYQYSRLTLAEVTKSNGQLFTVTPGHLFGTLHDDTRYTNWINQRLEALMGQTEIRSMSTRLNVGNVPLYPSPREATSDVNPYLFMMSLTKDNVSHLINWTENISDLVTKVLPGSQPLRCYTQPGNPEVLRHLVFESPIPTWHSGNIGDHTIITSSPDAANPFAVGSPCNSPTEFATALKFRSRKGLPAPSSTDTNSATAGEITPTTGLWKPNFVESRPNNGENDPIKRRDISEEPTSPDTPTANIFEPISSSDAFAHHVAVITSGKLIEIHDLTSITLPLPHPRRNLFIQNGHYACGAICADNIRATLSGTPVDIREVTGQSLLKTTLGFIRGSYHRLTLPHYRRGTVIQASNPLPLPSSSDAMSGALTIGYAHRAADSTNVFLTPDDSRHNIDDESVHLWTSYRWYNANLRKWFWLPTLRHIFGTRARTFITEHPANRIRS
jgi:hypothetical protein